MQERASNHGTKPSSGAASEAVMVAHRTSGARARYGSDLRRRQHRQQSAALLRLHRDICDGVELATEQVQDKRIEFLERGPEVKVADIFLTVALTLLLESPLAGLVVGLAFRFAGDVGRAAFLPSRRIKISKLQKRISVAASQMRPLESARAALRRNIAEQSRRATRGRRHVLISEAIDIRREIGRLENAVALTLTSSRQKLAAAQVKRTQVDNKNLRAFLDSIKEGAVETGVAVLNAAAAANDKKGDNALASNDLDSIGVQLQALAQRQLRDMEGFFSQIEADADLLRGIAGTHPYLRAACAGVLSEIYLAQQGTNPEGTLPTDVKRAVAHEIEKLLWAVLSAADRPPPSSQLPPAAEKLLNDGPPAAFMREGRDTMPALGRRKPPLGLLDYWRKRFFEGDTSDDEVVDAMRELKDRFFEKTEEPTIQILAELAFK